MALMVARPTGRDRQQDHRRHAPRSTCAPATRSGWSAATAPERPPCSGVLGGAQRAAIRIGQPPRRHRLPVPGPAQRRRPPRHELPRPRAVRPRPRRGDGTHREDDRGARGGSVRPRTSRRSPKPTSGSRRWAATRRVRGAPARRRPRPAPPTVSTCTSAPCPVVSAAGSSSPGSCSPAATCCSSTSPRTTSTPTPATGCCSSCGRTAARWS